jgi:hypothetical protein
MSLILVIATFTIMAAGSGSSDKKDIVDATTTASSDDQSAGAPAGNAADTTAAAQNAASVTIDEQVLFDQDGIRITATGMADDSIWGSGIKLLIENSSSKNLTVSCNAVIVNDYMITDLFAADVAAGKKSNETLTLMSNQLKDAGITEIGKVEIYFNIFDSETFDTVSTPDVVEIHTSAYDRMAVVKADSGTELLNQDGIRIVGKYVDENSIWGAGVLLYIENTTGKNVMVSCDNMSINGFMVNPVFVSTVYDQKMSLSCITIFQSDLDDNGIKSIDDIELSFTVSDNSSFSTILKTDPITFSAK